MAAEADVLRCLLMRRWGGRWVGRGERGREVIQDAVGARVRRDAVEVVLRYVQAEREDPHQPPRELETCLPVGHTAALEARQVRRPFPHVLFTAEPAPYVGGNNLRVLQVRVDLRSVAPHESLPVVARLGWAGMAGSASAPAVEVFGLGACNELLL